LLRHRPPFSCELGFILSCACPLFRVRHRSSPPVHPCGCSGAFPEVPFPHRDIGASSPLTGEAPMLHLCSALSVSRALEVLIRPSPAGLVSCRSRSWGLRLSRFAFSYRAVRPLGRLYPPAVDPRIRNRSGNPASGSCSLHESLSLPASTGWTATSLGFSPP